MGESVSVKQRWPHFVIQAKAAEDMRRHYLFAIYDAEARLADQAQARTSNRCS